MKAGRRRQVAGIGAGVGALVLVVTAVVVTRGGSGGSGGSAGSDAHDQSAEEISEISAQLPEGLTPLDQASPNPVGSDPLAIGTPPDIEPPSSPEELLARAAARLDQAASASASAQTKADPGAPDPGPQADGDSLLVSFAPATSADDIAAALAAAGVGGTPIEGTDIVEVDTTGRDQGAVSAALEDVEAVESVQPNLLRSIDANPNDPELGAQQPYLDEVLAPTAWNVADTGANVVVAVLDTGVDLDHPDLTPNLVAGRDIVDNDGTPQDDNGHGTQVAGIVGAATDNGIGVAGVAWNAKIMPVKVLDAEGFGSDADIASGIVWATDHGAQVINMSLGGPGTSSVIDQAVLYALEHEVVLVAAAGNAGSQAVNYPAAAPGVLGVTATDASGQFAWFSNYGPWYSLAAPGIDIRSTALASGPAAAYGSGTGTSFSSPIVAGVAALVRERHPGWGWFEVGDELLRTAHDAGPAGVDDEYGYGVVDAAAALGDGHIGPVSQPNLAGDAANLQSAARSILPGAAASEAIAYESDEDWFTFEVPTAAGLTVTVTPPPAREEGFRAAEMDPVVELHGPGGGLVARVDDMFGGEPEELNVNVGAGRHTLRVTNYFGSTSPGPYTVQVTLGPALPPTDWAPWQSVFAPGSDAEATALADFDGDGLQDVALFTGFDHYEPLENEFMLFVFAQQPGGTLGAPVVLPTHGPTGGVLQGVSWSLTAADLDGDGDPDLALSNETGLDVAWNQSGQITAPVLYPVGGPVQWSTAADLDGTGPVELVVRSATSTALRSLRWNGTGFTATSLGFDGPANYSAGIGYTVADLTNDGRPDIAAFVDGGIDIHPQQPGGGWGPPTHLAISRVGPGTTSLAAGDVTDDGRVDLVMVGGGNRPGPFLMYVVQQPDGSFGAPTTLASYDIPGPVKIGDVNADGRADAVVMHNGWNAVGVYRQTAGGTLATEELLQQPYASSFTHDGLALGDIDDDGVNDIVTANYNYGLVVVRHQGGPRTEGLGPWLSATTPATHATGVATSVRPQVTFGRNVLSGTVSSDTVFLVNGRSGAVVDAPVTFDGRTATLTPSRALQPGTPYQVWVAGVADASGTDVAYERIAFTTAAGGRPSYPVGGTYLALPLDLDGNGYQDIFFYGPGSVPDSIWFFGADGRTVTGAGVTGTYTPVVGDFNGNGYDDIFWYGPGSATDVMWWNGRNGITAQVVPVSGTYVPMAGDFNRNGYDDIFWYGPGATADSLWSFGSNGRTVVPDRVGGTSYRPLAADYTRDGYADILWYVPGTGTEGLWRGQPSGFLKGTSALAASGTYGTRSLDFNGDGFHEVFWYTTNRSYFWRSGTTNFVSSQAGPATPSGARPVAGDFTGDGRDDLFVYVPGTAVDTFYLGQANGVG